MKKFLVVMPFFIIAAAIIIVLIPRRSPVEKAFDKAVDAANAHDYAQFCRYVDVEGLIKSYIKLSQGVGGNSDLSGNVTEYNTKLENGIRYFIETERIPDPDRFKRLISTRISGKNGVAIIVLDLRKYAVVCTTSVMLRSTNDAQWQITGIELWRIWNRVKNSPRAGNGSSLSGLTEELTPSRLIWDIAYDPSE